MNFYFSGPNYSGRLPPARPHSARFRPVLPKKRASTGTRPCISSTSKVCARSPTGLGRRTPFRAASVAAVATLSDGLKHRVNYWIGEDTGMIGMMWGVEWCVVGLDRNWAYNPVCKMARP